MYETDTSDIFSLIIYNSKSQRYVKYILRKHIIYSIVFGVLIDSDDQYVAFLRRKWHNRKKCVLKYRKGNIAFDQKLEIILLFTFWMLGTTSNLSFNSWVLIANAWNCQTFDVNFNSSIRSLNRTLRSLMLNECIRFWTYNFDLSVQYIALKPIVLLLIVLSVEHSNIEETHKETAQFKVCFSHYRCVICSQ